MEGKFSFVCRFIGSNNKDHGYELAETSRRSSGHDYDGLEYEYTSNVQPNQRLDENVIVQNPYYESGVDSNGINGNVENLPHEPGDTENVTVVENPYYEWH